MPRIRHRATISLALTFIALGATGDLLLLATRGSRAPGWAHWWCSASSLKASHHGGGATTGFLATVLGAVRVALPHWPHILPIVVALGALVYLRRANARYHAHDGSVRALQRPTG
jgi:hypothetical protein